MDRDDELCLCFHVTRRKVENFIRVEKPQRPGQLSECFGAGTGCGWCGPFLQRLLEQARCNSTDALPTAREYGKLRSHFVRQRRGTPPPGAAPIEGDERP